MTTFDISPDGKQVLYTTPAPDGKAPLWVVPLDRSSPATKVSIFDAQSPHFGDHGRILFERTEGSKNYLEQMNPDGSHSSKVSQYPIAEFQSESPGRHWAIVNVAGTPETGRTGMTAIPLDGGVPRRICARRRVRRPRHSPVSRGLFRRRARFSAAAESFS